MLAILFLSGSALLGVALVRYAARNLLDVVEQILWGTVLGWIATAFVVYLSARWQQQLSPRTVLWVTLAIWIVVAILIVIELLRNGWSLKFRLDRERRYLGLIVLVLLLAQVYWRLLSVQVYQPGDSGIYSASAGNDLNFHAALISSFRYGQNFPPKYTLLPPESLFYPFMPDFHAAILMAGGLSLRSAIILTALLLGAVIAGLFYSFALRIARSQKVATLATLLFLLNGGFGFVQFFRDWWQSDKGPLEFWNTLPFNYAKLSERGIHWTNIVADMLVPQRTSLFGLSLGLMILTIFAFAWQRFDPPEIEPEIDRNKPRTVWLMIVAGVLAGILPLFHTHTYIAVGLVSVVLFVMRPRREWLAFWAPAVLLAAPQLLTLALHARGSSIVRFFFGWLGHDDPFFPLYLLRNFGLPLVLAIPAWWAAPREWRKFYFAFLFLFVFSFVIVFSPNLYDNGKLIYYWHAFNSVLVATWLIKLATVHRQRVLTVLLAFLSIATALIVFHSESITSSRVFTDEELTAAAFVREQTAPQAIFLTAPALKSPVLSLTGRPVVRSATAWLWSHGYEFRERESDVRRIYAGSADALELLRYYAVDYVYLGDAERSDVKANSAFFDANLPVIYHSQTITIYDARNPGNQARTMNPAAREFASRLERDPFSLIVEFPDTSFFVYRICKASYGRMPRRAEFMSAMTLLGRGVFIGAPGWNEQLEKNRLSLLVDWMNSEEFKQLHEGKSNAEFVAALLENSGAGLNSRQRDVLVENLDAKSHSRQTALLRIVEDKTFYKREYPNAYVLVHFFGYLRRNPDDAPDFDLKGFNFWRDRLNSWGDYRTISMAFMESDEYRNMKLAP
jgi:hypothetical protein